MSYFYSIQLRRWVRGATCFKLISNFPVVQNNTRVQSVNYVLQRGYALLYQSHKFSGLRPVYPLLDPYSSQFKEKFKTKEDIKNQRNVPHVGLMLSGLGLAIALCKNSDSAWGKL